jgi:crotonobetainyl-CoA:carnitine CoA-transferase CaiB-like acyl-CoA transferase
MNPATSRSDVRPLSDVTVVDLTQVMAGPYATMLLGDMGAEVVKIEAIGRGDRSRNSPPRPEYFDTMNRNKRSVALDLKSEEGQAVAESLLAEADVFVENTKPGRAAKFNLAYEDVREVNPNIVYCSITGFGSDSPYAGVPAYDMVVQAMSGIMSMTGEPDGPPLWSGLPSGDLAAAMYAVQSVLLALYARDTGQIDGEWIEVPMLDAAVSWLGPRAGHTFGTGEPFPRLGTQHLISAPFGVFQCADEPIVVAAGTNSLWYDLCAALDRPDLAAREDLDSRDGRAANVDELREELESTLAERPAEEWISRLHAAEVPAGPIHDTETVWEDDHVKRRGLRVEMEREDREDAVVIDNPIHFQHILSGPHRAPPDLAADTDDVLAELGYSDAEIGRLREDGVVD